MMQLSSVTDGFRLAYDRTGSGKSVVQLHDWPRDRTDYNLLVPELAGDADVIVPDLGDLVNRTSILSTQH